MTDLELEQMAEQLSALRQDFEQRIGRVLAVLNAEIKKRKKAALHAGH